MFHQRIVDADQHIVEPPDFWTSRMAKKYQDVAPQLVDYPDGGQAWSFEGGAWLRPMGLEGAAGQRPSDVSWKSSYDFMLPGCFDPKARLEAMDIDGVDHALLYPSIALSASSILDDELYIEVFRTYNDALWDWCAEGDPKRMHALAIIPACGVETAMQELDRVAKIGFKSLMFTSWPSGDANPTAADEPFWSLCESAGMVVSIHGKGFGRVSGSSGAVPGKKSSRVLRKVRQELINDHRASGLGVTGPVGQFVLTGILDRHPSLKLSMVETGTGWVPFFMEQLDRVYTHQRWMRDEQLSRLPSNYVRRQIKGTIQLDGMAMVYRHMIGVENIMFSTDYPHATCDWPNSRQWAHFIMRGVPEDEQDMIMQGNAAEWYGLN